MFYFKGGSSAYVFSEICELFTTHRHKTASVGNSLFFNNYKILFQFFRKSVRVFFLGLGFLGRLSEMREKYEKLLSGNDRKFIYFAVGFGKLARLTKSAVILGYEKFIYFALNQQSFQGAKKFFFRQTWGFLQESIRNFSKGSKSLSNRSNQAPSRVFIGFFGRSFFQKI